MQNNVANLLVCTAFQSTSERIHALSSWKQRSYQSQYRVLPSDGVRCTLSRLYLLLCSINGNIIELFVSSKNKMLNLRKNLFVAITAIVITRRF